VRDERRIALAPNDGDTARELLRHADIALARAKAEGGSTHALLRGKHGQSPAAETHGRARSAARSPPRTARRMGAPPRLQCRRHLERASDGCGQSFAGATESLLINDTEEVFGKLNRLRLLGIKIVMDDFGTGYSSFSYLARFAFDKIKIDREFARDMPRVPAMQAIVKILITLGNSLGVTVTAEGVESKDQAAMLREFGCQQAQ
jgi:predicted signal transduction protein with EAL and GGDEF domain